MMKKIFSLLLITLVLAFADEYLVRVDLTEARLSPLAQQGLKVLAELENCAILLLEDNDFDGISSFQYRVLDTNPQQGAYYLVLPMESVMDLTLYGDILTRDGDDYLIRVHNGMLEPLISRKVMVKRLSFTPMVIRSAVDFPAVRYDQTVADIVNLVDADSILTNVQRMQDFVTRHSTHDSCLAAANWVAERFSAYGCDSVYLQYHTTGFAPNVIGIKQGVLYPDSIYAVICGHVDATSYLQPIIAPGADDNASGVAAVIEAIRVTQDYQFEHAIRFIAFTGEEQGLYGSEYYAQLARTHGDSILGVLNADMIAYVDVQPESLEVFAKTSNPPCEPFADFFIAAADTYTTLLTSKRMTTSMVYSDHAPFWDQGYLALCSIEDFYVTNPYYHTPGDTIGAGFNDLPFCTEVTKAEIAALALLAIPYGTGIDEFVEVESENARFTVRPSIGKNLFTVSLTTESSGPVDLRIHDVTGRVVKNISIQSSEIGHLLSVKWDGTNNAGKELPDGIYFVRIANGTSPQTAKLVLLR